MTLQKTCSQSDVFESCHPAPQAAAAHAQLWLLLARDTFESPTAARASCSLLLLAERRGAAELGRSEATLVLPLTPIPLPLLRTATPPRARGIGAERAGPAS